MLHISLNVFRLSIELFHLERVVKYTNQKTFYENNDSYYLAYRICSHGNKLLTTEHWSTTKTFYYDTVYSVAKYNYDSTRNYFFRIFDSYEMNMIWSFFIYVNFRENIYNIIINDLFLFNFFFSTFKNCLK